MKTLDAIKKLNAVKKEDGELLLAEPIDLKELKGAKEKDLAEAYMNAIEGISVEDEDKVPDELADVYNALADAEKGIAAEAEKTVEKKPVAKVTEKKAPAKSAEKEAEAKKEVEKTPEKKAPAAKAPVKISEKKPSRKYTIYQTWVKKPKDTEGAYKLAASIGLSTLTAKSWIGQWGKGKNLPAGI